MADATIREHYASVARQSGLASSSTMSDRLIRHHETEAIAKFVSLTTGGSGRIADFGCGNGYTLGVVAERYPNLVLAGFEHTPEQLDLASQRFDGISRVSIHSADVREMGFWGHDPFDAVIVQRLIINLLNPEEQIRALDNIVSAIRVGGHALFLECFEEPFANLNEAREELDLDPIAPAHHNLYLRDGFFERPDLAPFEHRDWDYAPNHLSSHYFVSRAFEPALTRGRPFKRNSQVQRFFSMALPPAIGNFAPLLIHAFRRVHDART
jgi:SAM-dependent methyltransferase